jgi:site-specific DNA-methyltransferase (adenine-specific)
MKYLNQIAQGDCIKLMRELPAASVQFIFADPPFNIGKNYKGGHNDSLPLIEYQEWTYQWLDECIRLLRYNGVLAIHHIPKHALWIGGYLFEKLDFQNWIAWNAGSSVPVQTRLFPMHYAFLVFSQDKAKFNKNILIPHQTCRNCGEYLTDYGGKEYMRNPEGKRISDIWDDIGRKNFHIKTREANELPEQILDRFIRLYTDEGDVCLDPFMGSGTTAMSAKKLGRNYIGFEISEEYCQIARERIETNE